MIREQLQDMGQGLSKEESEEAVDLAHEIYPLLHGKEPAVVAGALADLVSAFLAGFQGDGRDDADDVRERILSDLLSAIRALIPIQAEAIRETYGLDKKPN